MNKIYILSHSHTLIRSFENVLNLFVQQNDIKLEYNVPEIPKEVEIPNFMLSEAMKITCASSFRGRVILVGIDIDKTCYASNKCPYLKNAIICEYNLKNLCQLISDHTSKMIKYNPCTGCNLYKRGDYPFYSQNILRTSCHDWIKNTQPLIYSDDTQAAIKEFNKGYETFSILIDMFIPKDQKEHIMTVWEMLKEIMGAADCNDYDRFKQKYTDLVKDENLLAGFPYSGYPLTTKKVKPSPIKDMKQDKKTNNKLEKTSNHLNDVYRALIIDDKPDGPKNAYLRICSKLNKYNLIDPVIWNLPKIPGTELDNIDFILLDLDFGGSEKDGVWFLNKMYEYNNKRKQNGQISIPILVYSDFNDFEQYVKNKLHFDHEEIFNLIPKSPLDDNDRANFAMSWTITRICRWIKNERERKAEKEKYRAKTKNKSLEPIKGECKGIQKVKKEIISYGPTKYPVLITGETGTGKELIAKAIHDLSNQDYKIYQRINCAAFPKDTIANELFGHEKEAFTGANTLKKGIFESADGGTVFLDEIGELPLDQQAIFLRVLQENRIRRVGGTKEIDVNVRIIAATNKDLKKEVSIGAFRDDLLFRLSIFEINIPPLRERKDDIAILAQHIIITYFMDNITNKQVSEADIEMLKQYEWPGNIRELQKIIIRACVLTPENESYLQIPIPNLDDEPNLSLKDSSSNNLIQKLLFEISHQLNEFDANKAYQRLFNQSLSNVIQENEISTPKPSIKDYLKILLLDIRQDDPDFDPAQVAHELFRAHKHSLPKKSEDKKLLCGKYEGVIKSSEEKNRWDALLDDYGDTRDKIIKETKESDKWRLEKGILIASCLKDIINETDTDIKSILNLKNAWYLALPMGFKSIRTMNQKILGFEKKHSVFYSENDKIRNFLVDKN